MNILNIIKFPNEILKKKRENVKIVTTNILNKIYSMINTMYYFDGIGLASTQVNIKESIIIINTTNEKKPLVIINPKIIKLSKTMIITKEGCLSFPNFFINIKRSSNIYLSFKDSKNKVQYIIVDNLLSICIQHEVDHINGITIYEKISKLKKNIFKKKQK